MAPPPRPLVVQVSPFYPPHLGGVENVTQALAQALSTTYEVRVLTTTCGSLGAARLEHGEHLTVERCWGVELAHTPVSPGLVRRLLTLRRDAIVHAHVAGAFLPEVVWLTGKLRRRPYLVHFHLDVDPSGTFGRLLPFYKRHLFARALRGASCVIVLSDEQAAFVSTTYGVPPGRILVLPNGVDPQFFMPARPSRDVTPEEPLRLLFVGRLDAQKNVGRLLAAMALLTEPVELVVVGDGEMGPELRRQAATTGLTRVRFAGAQRGPALLEWYRWAEAFVLPSDKEGMPLALLEAMAAALPIIATDVPGSRELLSGIGLLTEPSPAGLADGIARAAKDSSLRAVLADKGAAQARSLSWDRLATRVEDAYARL